MEERLTMDWTNQKAAFWVEEGLRMERTNQKAAIWVEEGLRMERTNQKAALWVVKQLLVGAKWSRLSHQAQSPPVSA